MLIRFKVSNYLSFDDIQTLSMISGKTGAHPSHVIKSKQIRLLRASAIYGANASGKSNVIKAMRAMRDLVVHNEFMILDTYCRINEDNREKSSLFEVEIQLDDRAFSYGFEVDIYNQSVVDEWLHELFYDRDSVAIFERTGDNISFDTTNSDNERMKLYVEDFSGKNDSLFLNFAGSRMNPKKSVFDPIPTVWGWFRDKMVFPDLNESFKPSDQLNEEYFNRLNELISTYGTGVNKLEYINRPGAEEMVPKEVIDKMKKLLMNDRGSMINAQQRRRYGTYYNYRVSMDDSNLRFDEIIYKHKNGTGFHSGEESDGTKRLFNVLSNLYVGRDGATIIVDELDLRFHPQVTYRLLDKFLADNRYSNIQLIFTTHESSLMDFDLLRRDEIWFVEKDDKGVSNLYSLEDFNERCDRNIEKAYKEGRYGGVPIFSTVFPYREDL